MEQAMAADAILQGDDLVTAIRKASAAMVRLQAGGMNERAIVALLHDSTLVAKGTIKTVLRGLKDLQKDYLTQETK
jgi:hypothetical protein